jgi:hypothetical protein
MKSNVPRQMKCQTPEVRNSIQHSETVFFSGTQSSVSFTAVSEIVHSTVSFFGVIAGHVNAVTKTVSDATTTTTIFSMATPVTAARGSNSTRNPFQREREKEKGDYSRDIQPSNRNNATRGTMTSRTSPASSSSRASPVMEWRPFPFNWRPKLRLGATRPKLCGPFS